MKVSDYIVKFLIERGVTDVFGYPGGMVTHLMDSLSACSDRIRTHVTYHEQSAAFAACGYAQTSGKPGVAYATSGPGATNLVTGIANAYYDSIPVIFITGQVNTFEAKGSYAIRQRGFQETDIVSIVSSITKYAVYVEKPEQVVRCLWKGYRKAVEGRKGPVLLDIPMDVLRADICLAERVEKDPDASLVDRGVTAVTVLKDCVSSDTGDSLCGLENDGAALFGDCMHNEEHVLCYVQLVEEALRKAKRPCILIGNGVKTAHLQGRLRKALQRLSIPIVTSMIAFDVPGELSWNYGFIGAYGERAANFIVAKSDLMITIGSRLDVRQVGAVRENFASNASLIRFDVDKGELEYPVHCGEHSVCLSMEETLSVLESVQDRSDRTEWLQICDRICKELKHSECPRYENVVMEIVSRYIPENTVITTDVGQNQVWVAQSFGLKSGQEVLFSGGLGAMGYALPAAIGAYYGSGGRKVACICGDGGLQMNIQELQFVARERLPIKIVILNNNALGMIRHFQEMYFDGNYCQTKPEGGYTAPNFAAVAQAYGIHSLRIDAHQLYNLSSVSSAVAFADDVSHSSNDYECQHLCPDLPNLESVEKASELPLLLKTVLNDDKPVLLEIIMSEDTYVFPKLEYGKPNQDQEPLIERTLYRYLMSL